MTNKNHFCIYCGAKLDFNQKFCTQCGKKVQRNNRNVEKIQSRYNDALDAIDEEYEFRQQNAKELINKLFDSNHFSYNKFLSSINESNKLFNMQLDVTRKMVDVCDGKNHFVEKEIDKKIELLKTFIGKMNDSIDEMVIRLSSNEHDIEDINNLFEDMDDLIDSVKDY